MVIYQLPTRKLYPDREGPSETSQSISGSKYRCDFVFVPDLNLFLVMRLLDLLDRGHSSEMLTIVFTETKRGADYLDNYLHDRGFSSTCIHGDRNQREREDAVRLFKVNIILG